MKPFYKIENDKALDIPVPYELEGLGAAELADLSWTPPELGLQNSVWWPAVEMPNPLPIDRKLTDDFILKLDYDNKQVLYSKATRLWTVEEFKALQDDLCEKINQAVVEATSSSTRFSLEYVRREEQARAYIATITALEYNAKIPPAPRLIANFAASAGVDPVYAARLTIEQADGLYAIQDELADLRMRKYEVMRATTVLEAAQLAGEIMGKIDAVAKTIT